MQALPQQSKSVNPFDTSEPSQVQTPVVCETSNLWLSFTDVSSECQGIVMS